MKKWMDMSNLPQEFRERVERLERNFEVSTVIFKKFEPIFFDMFQNPYEETFKLHRSRKQRYFLDLMWLFPGKGYSQYKFMKINFQSDEVSLTLKCSQCRNIPDPGGCSSGYLGFISSCCNAGTVPQWECQGVLGRATTGWVSSKDEHFESSAEIAEVAQEWFVLAQSSQRLGITPWSLCSKLSHPLTFMLPRACPGCQMSGKTNWEEVTADVLIFITNLRMCGVILHTHVECLPCWKELVHIPCKNMWLWQLFSENISLGMREPSCGSSRCFCQLSRCEGV